MTIHQTKILLWANFLLVAVIQLLATAAVALRLSIPEPVWIGVCAVVGFDLLCLTNRFVNHRFEIAKYLGLAAIFCLIDWAFLGKSPFLFLFEFAVLSFFVGCLLVRLAVRWGGERFQLSGEWDFFFDPINWVLTILLFAFTFGATLLAAFWMGR